VIARRRAGGADVRLTVRAFRHRNFRLFFFGQSISLIGTWMQQVAMSWLVYRLTGSALMLGWIGFLGQVPAFFLAPVAGVLADRWNKHHILLATQALSMVQAFALAALVFTGTVNVWHIIALATLLGCVNGFDIPARQSYLVQLVESREDLGNAIALNSSMFNGARLVGPAIAGIVIGLVGEAVCFLLNGISYIAVLVALLFIKTPRHLVATSATRVIAPLIEGFNYSFTKGPIRSVLLVVATVSMFGVPYTVLMPIFATEILKGDAATLGFLMSAVGLGATAGALYLAARPTVRGLGRVIVFAATLFSLSVIAFSQSRNMWLSLPLLLLSGFGMMLQMASCNTILQTIVDDDKRGRVMSFYTMAFIGTAPIGSLMAGLMASRIGAPLTTALGGGVCLLGAMIFARNLPVLREQVRPIYDRLGIPEMTAGVGNYSQLTVPPER
jgi:MFS family permease